MARTLDRRRDAPGLLRVAVAETRAGLAILTRLPVGAQPIEGSGAGAFGLVGAVVGLLGAVPLWMLGTEIPWVASILAIAILALVSGALHLDGLSDTADALVAIGPGAAERARNDPAAGPAGIVALVIVLGLQVSALATLLAATHAGVAGALLVTASSLGRTAAVVVARGSRGMAGRTDGTGARFAAGVTSGATLATVVVSTAVGGAATVATSSPVVVVAGAAAVISLAVGWLIVHARHGLDGDGLGAIVELTVTGTLLVGAIAVVLPAAA